MSHKKVIPTAWLVAYCRTFSDIPYSKEIFAELEKIRVSKNEKLPEIVKDSRLSPQFEARYKLVNRLLKTSGITQILEIAAGLSPRGMDMSADGLIQYIETDLPDLIGEKKEMAFRLMQKIPDNLHFEPVDALRIEDWERAARHFDLSNPIAVVHEGLLRYLSFDQKRTVAKNVYSLLQKFGGIWITPDISKRRIVHNSETVAHGLRDKMNELTGINIDNNLFENREHAIEFFTELGFTIEVHSFAEEKSNLVSPLSLNISKETVDLLLEPGDVFIMKIRN